MWYSVAMLEIRPSRPKMLIQSAVFIILVIALFFYVKSSSIDSVLIAVLVIIILATIITLLVYRVTLDSNNLTHVSIFGRKLISIQEIGSLTFRSGGRSGIRLAVLGKNNSNKLLSFNVNVFKKDDVKKLIDQLVISNPAITLSAQVKNFMEGKFYFAGPFGES
jgi:hypothetical protein